jgi:hypothetical protein
METTLHRQLKEFYCGDALAREVWVQDYRIDAVVAGELIEIQLASLSALRKKVPALLREHPVVVVKPLAAHKTIFRRDRKNGPVTSRRVSPRHETLLDLFQELVHFVDVFPHPRLRLEVLLTEQEEDRIRRVRRRRRSKDYRIEDRRLIGIHSRHVLKTAEDLVQLLPDDLPEQFTTADVARAAEIPRWLAQKMAYCLRRMEAITLSGKRSNALLYSRSQGNRRAA